LIRVNRKERWAGSEVHFFTSHFYSTLAKNGAKAVASWTTKKNIDIFSKKFIFIPINQSLHWSLCVVVNPGEIMNQIKYSKNDVREEALLPCMFFFDSLKAHRQAIIAKHVRNWLNSEWKRLKKAKECDEESPFDEKAMVVYSPRGEWHLYLLITLH
jgi:sentrin-specific protease 7